MQAIPSYLSKVYSQWETFRSTVWTIRLRLSQPHNAFRIRLSNHMSTSRTQWRSNWSKQHRLTRRRLWVKSHLSNQASASKQVRSSKHWYLRAIVLASLLTRITTESRRQCHLRTQQVVAVPVTPPTSAAWFLSRWPAPTTVLAVQPSNTRQANQPIYII